MSVQNNNHTFVVCAYKESSFLDECIESLKNQTLRSELLVYTSTPNKYIEGICKKYDVPLMTKEGGSIGKDWNNALSFVETDYATIAHQDDLYLPTYTESMMKLLENNQDGLIAYSNYREWKNGEVIPINTNLKIKNIMLKTMSMFNKSNFWRKKVLGFGNPICCPAVTYNLKKLNGFQFDEKMKVSLDWLAWYDIGMKKGRFLYDPSELMVHRIHDESETTNTIKDNIRTQEDIMMFNKFWNKHTANFIMKFYVKSQDSNN